MVRDLVASGAGTNPPSGDVASQVEFWREQAEGLRVAMRSRASIEQSKGMLMMSFGISEDRAFDLMANWSSVWNVKVQVIATALLSIGAQGRVDTPTELKRRLAEAVRQSPRPPAVG